MKSTLTYVCLIAAGTLSIGSQWIQDSAKNRFDELEERVQRLESIVYSTSQLKEEEAMRRLENAQRTLTHSKALLKKGFINDAQYKNDEFALQQAEQELQLARATGDRAKLGAELDLINAKQSLTEAERELEYIRKLAGKGFSTQFEVQRGERRVRNRERALELAEAKLNAFTDAKEQGAESGVK